MTTERSKKLTIFEGPDGGGKSTLAREYAARTGARYVHLGPFKSIDEDISRFYVEAMLPAILGYQDVVMDRCWISEPIYGAAHRDGANRIRATKTRMLERLALRCGAIVVVCRPPWEVVRDTWASRRSEELLSREKALHEVWQAYGEQVTQLPCFYYDYTSHTSGLAAIDLLESWSRHPRHLVSQATAGSLVAPVLLVGENFAEHGIYDPLYQWPFGSFSAMNSSFWLTGQLMGIGVSEQSLLWANADMDLPKILQEATHPALRVFALGGKAHEALRDAGKSHTHVVHPQHHKRFRHHESYPLIQHLQEIFK